MSILMITGTSTGVGKTVTTAALAVAARAAGRTVGVCKPAQTGVAAGESGDLAEVTRLSGVTATCELARYEDPLAPETAARRAGVAPLRLAETAAAITDFATHHDVTLVEGAGGVLVRLGAELTIIDLAQRLSAPVLVVAAPGLGTLNHSELTVAALRGAAVSCAGLVVGSRSVEPDLAERCNERDLPRLTGVSVVGAIPEGAAALDRRAFCVAAPTWFDRSWSTLRFGRSEGNRVGLPVSDTVEQ